MIPSFKFVATCVGPHWHEALQTCNSSVVNTPNLQHCICNCAKALQYRGIEKSGPSKTSARHTISADHIVLRTFGMNATRIGERNQTEGKHHPQRERKGLASLKIQGCGTLAVKWNREMELNICRDKFPTRPTSLDTFKSMSLVGWWRGEGRRCLIPLTMTAGKGSCYILYMRGMPNPFHLSTGTTVDIRQHPTNNSHERAEGAHHLTNSLIPGELRQTRLAYLLRLPDFAPSPSHRTHR